MGTFKGFPANGCEGRHPHSWIVGRHHRYGVFYQTFGFVAAICAGVIILSVFFVAVGYFRRVTTRGVDVVTLTGFIRDGKRVNVHISGGKSLPGVRFVGFTNQNSGKSGVPYQLAHMVVLETAKGARVLIRADMVKMIEEIEEG